MHLVNQQLNQAVAKFWKMELVTNEVLFNLEERNCMEHFARTVTRNTDGRFFIRMPVKEAKLLYNNSMILAISLNECFSVGPTLQEDLLSILLCFRTFRYVITADPNVSTSSDTRITNITSDNFLAKRFK